MRRALVVGFVTAGLLAALALPRLAPGQDKPAAAPSIRVEPEAFDFGSRQMVEFAVYDRTRLSPGDELTGPVLIDEGTATTVVHSGQHVAVEEHGYLLVTAVGGDA